MASTEAMLAARSRRMIRFETRLEWYGERVRNNIAIGMEQRLRAVGQLLRDKVVINLSVPVVKRVSRHKVTTPDGRQVWKSSTVVDPRSRSKPGEFPRADTTRLLKDIFWEFRPEEMAVRVGTTLDYGLRLEIRMQRSFLRRTLLEMADQLGLIIVQGHTVGPLPGQDTDEHVDGGGFDLGGLQPEEE